jgi:predicted CXXCH cytochrome family protein
MKRLLLLGVGSALMFTMGGVGSAQADSNSSTHRSTAAKAGDQNFLVSAGGGRCASCHRAHTAKAEKLLKLAQPALCYSCHASLGSNLDVVDGSSKGQALRGGGFEYAAIDGAGASKTMPAVLDPYQHPLSELVPVRMKAVLDPITGLPVLDPITGLAVPQVIDASAVTSRHQIDGTTQGTMWGNGAVSDTVGAPLAAGKTGVTLECGSCHDPHGNGNYRILRPVPNDAATTAVAATYEADGTTIKTAAVDAVVVAPVNIPDATVKNYTTTNYWLVADRFAGATGGTGTVADPFVPVATGTTDGYISNVAAWCTTCHTRYLAGSGSYKTPLTAGGKVDATFTYRHRSDRADKDGLNVPNCIQCHVSHGSNVAMTRSAATVAAPDGSNPGLAVGDTTGTGTGTGMVSRLLRVDNRGTCEMCHNV